MIISLKPLSLWYNANASPITLNYHHLNLKDDKIWITLENKHNYEYKHDWSPSITMEKDILYFIERLLLTLHKINIA